jgi:hypothetical protein
MRGVRARRQGLGERRDEGLRGGSLWQEVRRCDGPREGGIMRIRWGEATAFVALTGGYLELVGVRVSGAQGGLVWHTRQISRDSIKRYRRRVERDDGGAVQN